MDGAREDHPREDVIVFIRQMLGELRMMAERERCEALCWLIEMAYVEAGDIQLGRMPSEVRIGKADEAGRMTG